MILSCAVAVSSTRVRCWSIIDITDVAEKRGKVDFGGEKFILLNAAVGAISARSVDEGLLTALCICSNKSEHIWVLCEAQK